MKKLTIFDSEKVAVLIQTDKGIILEFAVTEGIRKDIQRWIDRGISFYRDNSDATRLEGIKRIYSDHPDFLQRVAERAQSYTFKTEITDEMPSL